MQEEQNNLEELQEENPTADETMAQPEGPVVRISYVMRFQDLFGFTMRYALTGLNGFAYWLVLALLIFRIATGFADDTNNIRALLIIALVFLLIMTPGNILLRTLQQSNLAAKKKLMTEYEVSSLGIRIRQGEAEELVPWKRIRKVKETKGYLYAYVLKNSAFIFPKDIVGEQMDTLRELLKTYAPAEAKKQR